MNRKLKALGLALFAVMALGAFSAATASAQFHSEAEHTIIDGAQGAVPDVFTVKAGTVKCNTATYSGTVTGKTVESVTASPTYSGCTAFGFVSAEIHMNGCTYKFTTTATQQLHIECPAGKEITVTAPNCIVHIPAQTLSGITYTNEGATTTRDIKVGAAISGITYTQTNKNFPGCAGGEGHFSDGTYHGSATVKGTDTAEKHVGIWKTAV